MLKKKKETDKTLVNFSYLDGFLVSLLLPPYLHPTPSNSSSGVFLAPYQYVEINQVLVSSKKADIIHRILKLFS